MLIEAVVGFLFSADTSKILLIQKFNPEWQRGLLNGIGGKLEEGETFGEAMIRECQEESGLRDIPWQEFAEMSFRNYRINLYRAFSDKIFNITQGLIPNEPLVVIHRESLNFSYTLPNLRWLIPLALDQDVSKVLISY